MKSLINATKIEAPTPEDADAKMEFLRLSMDLDRVGILVDDYPDYTENKKPTRVVFFYYTQDALDYLKIMLTSSKELRNLTLRAAKEIKKYKWED